MKKPDKDGVIESGRLNELVIHHTVRKNGSLRIQTDFSYCPTMAEQHTAHLSDINYLMSKYKPDEIAAYIAARNQFRAEILGHDFSQEPSLQDAQNTIYKMKQDFENLDPEVKQHFKNHVEFLKFIDNPANQEKMLKLGLMTKREIQKHATPTTSPDPTLQPISPSPNSSKTDPGTASRSDA